MNITYAPLTARAAVTLAVLSLALPANAGTGRSIDEHRAFDPQGQVEIINVSGHIDVVGWDKPEIEVTGTLGADIDRLDITASGSRATVRAVLKQTPGAHLGSDNSRAMLIVHVPQKSDLTAALISADVTVKDLRGNQDIHTVSGDVRTTTAREARVRTISGDVWLTAATESRLLEVGTISGDVHVTGGNGEIRVNTVSGDGVLSLGTFNRANVKTVSGNYSLTLGLAPDGRLEAQSVSGDLKVEFTGGLPPAEFDLASFSGDLSTCFGKKPVSEQYGPGSRLSFREGSGSARVRIDTKSGDVSLCMKL